MREFSPIGGNEGYGACEDEAASYFGSFDMIDQSELDRLSKEYEQASEYRKSLESQYEQPVDMDSWGIWGPRQSRKALLGRGRAAK